MAAKRQADRGMLTVLFGYRDRDYGRHRSVFLVPRIRLTCYARHNSGLLVWYGIERSTQLTFHFKTSNAKKTDLLVRKLNQLTLIRAVSIHEAKKAPSSADMEVRAFCERALTLVAVNICRIKLPPGYKTGYKFIGMPSDLGGWARITISGKTKRYG